MRNIGKHQMLLNLIGNIFASREANFVSATMFPRVSKHGNISYTSKYKQNKPEISTINIAYIYVHIFLDNF